MAKAKTPPRPPWRTVKHPTTGRTVTYAVIRRGGRKVVLIKRG